MIAQIGEADPDQPHHRRAGGADYRPLQLAVSEQLPGRVGDDFRGTGYLKHIIEAQPFQAAEYDVNIVEMIELAVKSGSGQGHGILKIFQHGQGIVIRLFGMVRADADAFAAVDAAFRDDLRFAAPHPDGLGGAALDAVGASHTFVPVQRDGMKESVHWDTTCLSVE